MRESIKRVMASTLGVPAEEIPDDATINEFSQWDSLGHLELMLALEMEFSVYVSTNMMVELVSLEAIEDYLRKQTPIKSG